VVTLLGEDLVVLVFTYCRKSTEGVEFPPSRRISGSELYQPSTCVYKSRTSVLVSKSGSAYMTYRAPWIRVESWQRLLYTARTLLGCRRSRPCSICSPAYGIHSRNSSLSNAVGSSTKTPCREKCGRQPVASDQALCIITS
jgi:hypothetical protein